MTKLNIGGGDDFTPFVKCNAKTGKWSLPGEDGDAGIDDPTFIADLANIRTGHLCFREGQAPERVIDPSLDRPAPCPGEGFKRGFVLSVYSKKFIGGLVEFSSNSTYVGDAINEIYKKYDADRGNQPGKLPVIACTGLEAMKSKYGTNYKPVMQLTKWVARPADMPDQSPVDDAEVWQPEAPAKQQLDLVPPSQEAPAAQTPSADDQPPVDDLDDTEF